MVAISKLRAISALGAAPVAEREDEPSAPSPSGSSQVPGDSALVGLCIEARHPTLQGRAKVRWHQADGSEHERWLPTLLTVTVRNGDRVLMMRPGNYDEPIIVGVVDGFAQRPERPTAHGPQLELARDEALQIHAPSGELLLELRWSEAGPVVKLLSADAGLHLPGVLSISAQSISLKARQGEVAIAASDDVLVRGATVRLN